MGKQLKSDGKQLDVVDTQQPSFSTHPVSATPDVASDVLLNAVTLEVIATLKEDQASRQASRRSPASSKLKSCRYATSPI